ncbi:restriction endonuclease [Leifsonia sp. Le1]|uniref:restriction endonuclease n=1 Tax=Leifsonia sp. Le1 TaxID=3404918 RepID=UPI003EB9F524
MVRNYRSLSDHDFELLVADLLGADESLRYEPFARGADLGVDLRRIAGGEVHVVQCKHMVGSTSRSFVRQREMRSQNSPDSTRNLPATGSSQLRN